MQKQIASDILVIFIDLHCDELQNIQHIHLVRLSTAPTDRHLLHVWFELVPRVSVTCVVVCALPDLPSSETGNVM